MGTSYVSKKKKKKKCSPIALWWTKKNDEQWVKSQKYQTSMQPWISREGSTFFSFPS